MFELGDIVRDTITGLEGVVVGRTDYLYGCRRYQIAPRDLKDGKPVRQESADSGQPGDRERKR